MNLFVLDLARSSKKQHSENTDKWYLCKAGSFSYSESSDSFPWSNFTPLVKQWCGETLGHGGSWACLSPVYDYEWNHAATSAKHAPKSSLKNMPKKADEKKEESYKMLKGSQLVLGFLHSIKHTGSPQDESYIHSYFIPWQNNKSSKCKLLRKRKRQLTQHFTALGSQHRGH